MLEGITWYRQSALRFADGERTIYIDPWGTGAGDPAAGVAVIDLEDCCEEGATARQEAPPTTAASAPASSTLRFRSTPCETTV